jgi:5-formyltetrahydrofolate cyclo-ligase
MRESVASATIPAMTAVAENDSPARSLHERKAVLRALVIAERDALPAPVRAELSRSIVAALTAMPSYREARCALLTSSFGSEVETGGLIERTLAADKVLVLPLVNKQSRMLELFEVTDPPGQLARGTYGIAEPRPDRCRRASHDEVDWILVPGVVFADDGYRIGYGGGYYDRLLPLLPSRAPRISAAYQLQRRREVPHGVHDQKVDVIVTEAGVTGVASSGC